MLPGHHVGLHRRMRSTPCRQQKRRRADRPSGRNRSRVLWQFVAYEPAASTQGTPSFQEVEQQLHLGNSSDGSSGIFSIQNAPSAPNVMSGIS